MEDTRSYLETLSGWAFSNVPSILGIATAAIMGGLSGFVAGLLLYVFLQNYRKN